MEKPLGTGSPRKTASPLREARRWRHQSVFPRPDGTGQSAFQFPQGTAWRRPASSIMVEPASASARGSRSSAIDQATDSTEDRKSTRLNSVTNAHLVCRILLETTNTHTTT